MFRKASCPQSGSELESRIWLDFSAFALREGGNRSLLYVYNERPCVRPSALRSKHACFEVTAAKTATTQVLPQS